MGSFHKFGFLKNTVLQAVLLMLFWLLLSGLYDAMHIAFGAFSVLVVLLMNVPLRKRLLSLEDGCDEPALRLLRLIAYVPWLLWQIVIASLQVAWVVLHPGCPIDPALLRFRARLGSLCAKVILGNSITLTPGTITLEIEEDQFLVHSLMDMSSSGIVDGSLPGKVAQLYERNPGQVVSDVQFLRSADGA